MFVRHGLVDCVMETEKMIRRSAVLSEAGLRDMKDIMILLKLVEATYNHFFRKANKHS